MRLTTILMTLIIISIMLIGLLALAGCSDSTNPRKNNLYNNGIPQEEDDSQRGIPDDLKEIAENKERDSLPEEMPSLDCESIDEVADFFENAQSQEEVSDYCSENRIECMNYCRQINPDNEFCSSIKTVINPRSR